MTRDGDETAEFKRDQAAGTDSEDTEEEPAPGAVAGSKKAERDLEPTHVEAIPPVEDDMDSDPGGGEAAAAAWAAGGTPTAETIPGDDPGAWPEPTLDPFVSGAEAGSVDPAYPGEVEEAPVVAVTSGVDDAGAGPEGALPAEDHPGFDDDRDPVAQPTPDALMTSRGQTIIAPAVVEKIAGRAASEVDGVLGVHSSGFGRLTDLLTGDSDKRTASATADVDRTSAGVDLNVSVRYPQPVGRLAAQVRKHVKQRVQEMTGLEVTEINITVPELVTETERPPRRRVE